MSEKAGKLDCTKITASLDIQPHEFVMVGNSLKSDILPVLALGGHGFHVPYHVTGVMNMSINKLSIPTGTLNTITDILRSFEFERNSYTAHPAPP